MGGAGERPSLSLCGVLSRALSPFLTSLSTLLSFTGTLCLSAATPAKHGLFLSLSPSLCSSTVEFKFVRVGCHGEVHWEEGPNHSLEWLVRE